MTEKEGMAVIGRKLVAIGLVAAFSACGSPDASSDSTEPTTSRNAEATEAVTERVREIGEDAALTLAGELFGRLNTEIEAQGHLGAIGFCSEEALPATGAVSEALEGGLEIKRTSSRYRNPANAPDDRELDVLQYFEREYALDTDPPEYVVQKVSSREYRYYKPLVVVPPCLACHGDPSDMEPAVREKLAELYPEDLATGYGAGDLRGVIRVSIPTEALAEKAAAD